MSQPIKGNGYSKKVKNYKIMRKPTCSFPGFYRRPTVLLECAVLFFPQKYYMFCSITHKLFGLSNQNFNSK